MGGMESERRTRQSLAVFLILAAVLLTSCARHHVVSEKPRRLPEKGMGRKGVYHVVERHQTLYRICKTYNVDINDVAALNRITDHHQIQVGQRIFIPGARKVLKVEIYIEDVVGEWGAKGEEKVVLKKLDFIWPVTGPRSAACEESERDRHQGIDIRAPLGTPIKASSSGVVLYAGNTIKGYGNLIILRHDGGWTTVYAHNQSNLVEEGMTVEKGQVIGKVGQTGRASGSHLHFEIRRNNRAVDPVLYLK